MYATISDKHKIQLIKSISPHLTKKKYNDIYNFIMNNNIDFEKSYNYALFNLNNFKTEELNKLFNIIFD